MAAAAGFLLVVLCAAPGLLAVERLTRARAPLERFGLGLAAGLAMALIAAYLAALIGALWLCPAILAASMVGLAAWRVISPPARPPRQTEPRATLLAVGVAVVAWAWFAWPMLARAYPRGWDPAFHTAVVEAIRTQGRFPATWAPYEPGEPFDYPAALHALMAVVSKLTGLASEQVFTATFLWAGALMLVLVLALGSRFGGGPRAGALAVALYGLTSGWGTLASHGAWGGIANLAGLVLMAGFVLAVLEQGRGALAVAAVCAAAAALCHHLSFALLAWSAGYLVAMELVSERRLSPVGRQALLGTAIAAATAGLAVLAQPTGRFPLSVALHFEAERMLGWHVALDVMGLPMLVAGGLGLLAVLFTHRSPTERALPAWTLGLATFWVAFDIVYRATAFWLTGQNYTAFTPSRGLTDAAVPLAVCAAAGAERLLRRSRWADVSIPAVAIALAALGWSAERHLAQAAGNETEWADAKELCAEVRVRTPPDAVVFAANEPEVGIWLPYLCGREFNYFPQPTYGMTPYRERKARSPGPEEFASYLGGEKKKSVYYATRFGSAGTLVATVGPWRLYELARRAEGALP